MFIVIIFTGIYLLITLAKARHKPPEADPTLLKRFYYSEINYRNDRVKKMDNLDEEIEKAEKKLAEEKDKVKQLALKKERDTQEHIVEKSRKEKEGILPIFLGTDVEEGNEHTVDLTSLPHLLIGGASGQGKSNFLNCLITGLSKLPTTLAQLHLVDAAKQGVEFNEYKKLKNATVYESGRSCIEMLRDQREEMMRRLKILKANQAKTLSQLSTKIDKPIPYVIIVIDEFANILFSSTKEKDEFTQLVIHFAATGRATGFHLVLATQRPDRDAVHPDIKSNVGASIAFKVRAPENSRIILGTHGAEKLRKKGECLFAHGADLIRIQTPLFKGQ